MQALSGDFSDHFRSRTERLVRHGVDSRNSGAAERIRRPGPTREPLTCPDSPRRGDPRNGHGRGVLEGERRNGGKEWEAIEDARHMVGATHPRPRVATRPTPNRQALPPSRAPEPADRVASDLHERPALACRVLVRATTRAPTRTPKRTRDRQAQCLTRVTFGLAGLPTFGGVHAIATNRLRTGFGPSGSRCNSTSLSYPERIPTGFRRYWV
jgi:hypothetical protein